MQKIVLLLASTFVFVFSALLMLFDVQAAPAKHSAAHKSTTGAADTSTASRTAADASTVTNKSTSAAAGSAVAADADTSSDAAKALEPDQVYQQERREYLEKLKNWQPSANSPRAEKVVRLMRPFLLKYAELPLKLVDQKIDGDKATLSYKSADPAVDVSLVVGFEKKEGKWSISERSYTGKDSIGLAPLPISGLLAIFPVELSLFSFFGTIFFLSLAVLSFASLWLIVVAFKVSLPWGLVVLFVPFGNVIFICCNFQKAKSTFFVGLASMIACFASLIVFPIVIASAHDIQETLAKLE